MGDWQGVGRARFFVALWRHCLTIRFATGRLAVGRMVWLLLMGTLGSPCVATAAGQSQSSPMLVSVTVVRSCSVAASETVTISCASGAATTVRPARQPTPDRDGGQSASHPCTSQTIFVPVAGSPADPRISFVYGDRRLVVSVDF
jgi:hypothetical protein